MMFVTQDKESFGIVLDYRSYSFVQGIVEMLHLELHSVKESCKTKPKVLCGTTFKSIKERLTGN